jgi:tetratricopeptide (TPR) repeat protein
MNLRNAMLRLIQALPPIMQCDLAAAWDRLEAVDDQFSYLPRELLAARLHELAGDAESARASYEAARLHLQATVRDRPADERIASSLGLAYTGLGRKQDAIRQGLLGVEMLPVEREALRGAQRRTELAEIYARLGEPDLAIDQLGFLLERPGFLSMSYLRIDPTWDPIREHPRFEALVGG